MCFMYTFHRVESLCPLLLRYFLFLSKLEVAEGLLGLTQRRNRAKETHNVDGYHTDHSIKTPCKHKALRL